MGPITRSFLTAYLLPIIVASIVDVSKLVTQFGLGMRLDISRVSILKYLHILHGNYTGYIDRCLQEVADLDDSHIGDFLLQQLHNA